MPGALVCGRRCFAGFRTANLHVRRVKQGTPSTHPILGDELRTLRRLQREQEPRSPFAICLVVRVQPPFLTDPPLPWGSIREPRQEMGCRDLRAQEDGH
jgi:hypothetical protein